MRRFKEKDGATSAGGALVQRVACGPIEGAGPRNGPNWPQLFGPKTGPERRSKPQKATGGIRKKGQLLGANIKACLGRGGPDLMGSNLYEDAKCSKAQKQIQKQGETGSLKCGSVISTGQKDIMHSEGETRREDEGDRPGVKGSSSSDALDDPAWICAGGYLRAEYEERTGLKDCYSADCWEKAGPREMSYFFISPSQGPSEKGYPNRKALGIVDSGIRGSKAEVAEDFRRHTCGSRYETESPSYICSVFGRPLLSGGPSGLGNSLEDVELGDLAPLRVVTADGLEWGEKISKDFSDAIIVTESCGDGEEDVAKTRTECLGYEKWEDSSLIKFSEYLGIPTMGYEAEILELLRKMVSQQSGNKRKGNPAESRSERELRKLECTINYNGKGQNRGGRDRGDFLLKLK